MLHAIVHAQVTAVVWTLLLTDGDAFLLRAAALKEWPPRADGRPEPMAARSCVELIWLSTGSSTR